MMGENILDDTHPETNQFADCKIKYLVAENKIMTAQLGSISTLVDKYKKIIDLLSKSQINSPINEHECKQDESQKPAEEESRSEIS